MPELQQFTPDQINNLVNAADANKTAEAASHDENRSSSLLMALTETDKRTTNVRLTEIQAELAKLKAAIEAGTADEETFLAHKNLAAEENTLLAVTQQEQMKKTLSIITNPINRLFSKIFEKVMAPVNEPLEALRSAALDNWLKDRKAAGKSNFLNIPATLKMMGLVFGGASPHALSDKITKSQAHTSSGKTNLEHNVSKIQTPTK